MNKKIVFLALLAGAFSSRLEALFNRLSRPPEALRELFESQEQKWLKWEYITSKNFVLEWAKQWQHELTVYEKQHVWLRQALPLWTQQSHGQQGQEAMDSWVQWQKGRREKQLEWIEFYWQELNEWRDQRHHAIRERDENHEVVYERVRQKRLDLSREWCQKQLEWDALTHGRQEWQQGW